MQNIGFGTAAIGRPQYINIRQEEIALFNLDTFKKKGLQILDTAYANGIRYFDTAPGYGLAEELLIDWIKDKADPTIEIATKWGYSYVANFDPKATVHEIKDHSIKLLNAQWKQSQQLLPYLTTYQIHSATFETGVLENAAVLNRLAELKSENNLRIGLTTTGANQVDVIQRALDIKINESALFDVFQITYNIMDQSLSKIVDLLHDSGKRIVIKEALANGRILPNSNYPHHEALYQKLNTMAAKHNVGVDAIAMRFCIDTINPFCSLSGASIPDQFLRNIKSNDFKLEEQDLSILKSFGLDPEVYWSERKQLAWT